MCIFSVFIIFPVAGKKGERRMKKKKKWCAESVGLLPNCIAKGEGIGVAIQSLYCRNLGLVG